MRLGVLDIGSNSAQLLAVDTRPGAPPLPAHGIKEPTLLAERIEPDGSIAQEGIQQVAESVARAVQAAQRFGVDQLYPFATSAIRDAPNREEVVERIWQLSGVRPQFLSGQQEARLTYLAVHRWYGWSAGRILMLDIGGGSMEIVLGRDTEPELAVSLPLGAGRLTRQFLPDDPPAPEQLKRLRRHVRDTLGEVADRLHWEGDARRVVATSKTFKQLARLAGAAPQRKGPFCRRTLAIDDVRDRIPRLAAMPAAKRARLRGISQPRARQILAGAVTAHATMAALNITELEISPWALREGIVLEHLSVLAPIAEQRQLPLQALSRTTGATVMALPQR
ncbi:MAG TPA: Ppx/GppA phosphatase family protein [Pseudonocardiaceae bacterium]|jgi:exopolyphosphatase/guanosine-5'-triphosphate,3'-diphosphate pyrophosphatase